ncbi:hypothetical protein BRC81_07900 [Halobacteriales archaeon QS_1_68_20]|nr:MAG: hypothetical protein BRC81_07900 [Halobacteriales archaeon QS_1_68_20]
MYGVVTRNVEETEWPEFDLPFYEVKDVTGRQTEPVPGAVNMVSCFGDNNAADDPGLVSVDDEGNPATRERTYFDWTYVCPTNDDYREGMLSIIEACAEANGDVRLDDVGFARPEYCHCDRCDERFAASDYEDRQAWRASVIESFVAEAADRIPGRVYLTLFPDPYPGHLYERAGIDVDALSTHVDEFVVPLYDMAYSTTYWLKTIASGFADLLPAPFSVELYAVDVDVENLVKAAEVADAYGENVVFGYDAGNARAAVRRLQANEGESFGEPA